MDATFKTKMRKNAGSMITVVPAMLVKLLKAESKDEVVWTLKIENGNPRISVEFKDKSSV